MAAAYFSLVFVLSHLVILHSADEMSNHPNCPPFSCGKFKSIGFPFYNGIHTDCGLFPIYDCTKEAEAQWIDLGPHLWYQVDSITQDSTTSTIKIPREDSCQSFNSLTDLPHSSYFYFTTDQPNITLFKCNHDVILPSDVNYTNCDGDFNIYYNHTTPDYGTQLSVPPNCSIIQLPSKRDPPIKDDIFSLLADEFSLELRVSEECFSCHRKGGQCQSDSKGDFYCADAEIGNKTRRLKLALATSVAGFGVLVFIVLCLIRKFTYGKSMVFWKKESQANLRIKAYLENYESLAPKRYTYSDIKKITNTFKDKLGQGAYGGVYKGKLRDGRLVAVKILNTLKGNGEEFINEVAGISRTSHVNIVALLGFCYEGSKRALIYEFMSNGSLEKFIYEKIPFKENRQLEWETLYQIAIGIARGLEYLHNGCTTRILHFDIKPHNILLDVDFCPKISDFGLAKLCPGKESIISMLGGRGTAGYIAPEVFCRNFGGISHKSDVYSYGMMVLEMVGGRKNINAEVDRTSEIYFPHWIYNRLELGDELGLHGLKNNDENEKARKMILVSLWCIQTDPSNRPPISRVLDMLEGKLESILIPPKPFLSSPPRVPADSSSTPVVTL